MSKSLTLYAPSAGNGLGKNVFGKDVANYSLFRALLLYGGLEQINFLTANGASAEAIRASLISDTSVKTKVTSDHLLAIQPAKKSGAILRGSAEIASLIWDRRRHHATSDYSLIGLIHTLAPPAIRDDISKLITAPTMPWDALVCTSPSVKTAVENMFGDWQDYYQARFGGTNSTAPNLPLIPLGVEAKDFASTPETPRKRAALRQELNVGEEEILVLWVGRLSFYEKAFPQPMMLAIEAAAKLSGKGVHFAMAGWFPGGEVDEKLYREAAAICAPNVQFHIIDGNDKPRLGQAWAAADIFISLVDNIQETFGITPIEAMASGLPVVVSDWDGYRYTVRDGQDGFLIPTLLGQPSPITENLIAQHNHGMKTYQQYVAITAQHTAVSVGHAAARLAELFVSRELRHAMGTAGQRRVLDTFDWSVVASQYVALATQLGEIRLSVPQDTHTGLVARGHHPARSDPFHAFANFPTEILTSTISLRVDPEFDPADLDRMSQARLISYARDWRLNIVETKEMIEVLITLGPMPLAALLQKVPTQNHQKAKMALLWLAKIGVVEWA
jgi:glycosyltransferase involved in cell wall biosynthesis